MPRKIVRISQPVQISSAGETRPVSFAKADPVDFDSAVESLADNLVAVTPCASEAWQEDNPHHMNYNLEKPGQWQFHMQNRIWKVVNELGYKRVFFHLPFGKSTGQSPRSKHERETGIVDESLERWHMSLDHVRDLKRTGNEHIMTDFYEALDWLHERAPHVEVIVYLGSYDSEDKRRIENGEYADVFKDWWDGLAGLLDRDYVSIVFDAAVGKEPDHINARLVQLVQDAKKLQDRWVGVEARIQKHRPWPNDMGMTCVAWGSTWRRQAHSGNIPREQLTVPPLVVYDGHARKEVDAKYDGDWFAYMAEDYAADCQLGPSPLGGEMKDLTTREVASRVLSFFEVDDSEDTEPETGVGAAVIDSDGEAKGDEMPKKNALVLWTDFPEGAELSEDKMNNMKQEVALAIYRVIAE